jgi:hypothetical protein
MKMNDLMKDVEKNKADFYKDLLTKEEIELQEALRKKEEKQQDNQ